MLHTKFRGNRPTGSGEEYFWRVFTIDGHGGHLVMWPASCHQIFTIWTNYDRLQSPMLHTKFRENRPAGSGEEDFWRVFTLYGRGGHLGHVTQMPRTKYRSPYPRRLHIKFGFDWQSGFGEEDLWALWTTTTDDDGRTLDHEYPISSPMRWAKKQCTYFLTRNDQIFFVTLKDICHLSHKGRTGNGKQHDFQLRFAAKKHFT